MRTGALPRMCPARPASPIPEPRRLGGQQREEGGSGPPLPLASLQTGCTPAPRHVASPGGLGWAWGVGEEPQGSTPPLVASLPPSTCPSTVPKSPSSGRAAFSWTQIRSPDDHRSGHCRPPLPLGTVWARQGAGGSLAGPQEVGTLWALLAQGLGMGPAAPSGDARDPRRAGRAPQWQLTPVCTRPESHPGSHRQGRGEAGMASLQPGLVSAQCPPRRPSPLLCVERHFKGVNEGQEGTNRGDDRLTALWPSTASGRPGLRSAQVQSRGSSGPHGEGTPRYHTGLEKGPGRAQ